MLKGLFFYMKKRRIEIIMAVLLLMGVFILFQSDYLPVSSVAKEKRVIIIDPGHGGDDPGVVGIDNIKEKDVNLEVSMLLQKKLKKAGYEVVMTRDADVGLYEPGSKHKKVQDMQKRCQIIEEINPICTISIHQNSYPDAAVKGPQVFYFTHSDTGKNLAKSIQDELNVKLEVERPRVEKGNTTYYMLKRSASPTVIVECGFLSNQDESRKLQDKSYQKKIVDAIMEGSSRFIDTQTKNIKNN